jgi:glutaryl-CoA dehydrogenase
MATTVDTDSAVMALPSVQLPAHAGDLFNIDAALTEEERSIRDTVRAFVN